MKTKDRVGFAVVGLGSIATGSVLPAFARARNAKLIALVSRDRRKAAQLAKKFSAKTSYARDEYASCLRNPEVAAVYITTPPGDHLELTAQAALAGKHVLCEKPLAATFEQSAEMVRACDKAGVMLMTAYRKYFEPATLYLKNLVGHGDLGKLKMIHTAFSELYVPGVSLEWLLDWKMAGGGPLMDLGVYCVNTSRWLVDEDPVVVHASSWSRDKARFQQVEEGILFSMDFPSGLVVQGSSTYDAALSSLFYVQGTEGWACLSPAFPFDQQRRLTGQMGKRRIERTFKVTDEFALEIDAFAGAIRTGQPVEPDGLQGHRDMAILRAIYESAQKKSAVGIRYES